MCVCVIIIIIDGGRGKTGGVAMQGCGGQVHTANIHTYIHLTYIYKCIHKYTYPTYTYTHTHLYNFKYFLFSMIFLSRAAMEKRFTSHQWQIVPVQKIRKVSFLCILFILHTYIHIAQMHIYIQHIYIHAPCTHTYIQHTDIHIPSTHTYFLFFQPYTMRFSSEEN